MALGLGLEALTPAARTPTRQLLGTVQGLPILGPGMRMEQCQGRGPAWQTRPGTPVKPQPRSWPGQLGCKHSICAVSGAHLWPWLRSGGPGARILGLLLQGATATRASPGVQGAGRSAAGVPSGRCPARSVPSFGGSLSHHPPRVAPARAARQTQGPGAKRKRVRVRPAPGRRGGRSLCWAAEHLGDPSLPPPGAGPNAQPGCARPCAVSCAPQAPATLNAAGRIPGSWGGRAPPLRAEDVMCGWCQQVHGPQEAERASWGLGIRHREPCSLLPPLFPTPGTRKRKICWKCTFPLATPPSSAFTDLKEK